MKCNNCARKGDLVAQFVVKAKEGDWVFRYYLCRWHRAAETRANGKKKEIVQYIPDEVLLKKDEGREIE